MKQPTSPLLRFTVRARSLAGGLWLRLRQQQETSIQEEIGSGALIGWGACMVFSWGFPALPMAVVALCGLCAGAAIGLLLWTGSTAINDEQIAPGCREKPTDARKHDWRPPWP